LHGSRARSAVGFAEAVVVRRGSLVAPHVIAPSAYMRDALERSWIGPLSTIHLVRHPVEPRRERWHGGGGYLLYAGRLSAEKGVEVLERVCSSVGIPLLIAGDGPLVGALRARIASGRSTAQLLGQLTQEELDLYRLACLAQVVPSSWPEVAGLVALEAAALGVPLLVADRGGLPEVLTLGARGVAVDFRDQAQVAAAIRQMLSAPPPERSGLPASLGWSEHLMQVERVYATATAAAAKD
jgi:glycosyltransferase involved in cell wall biosynthesis